MDTNEALGWACFLLLAWRNQSLVLCCSFSESRPCIPIVRLKQVSNLAICNYESGLNLKVPSKTQPLMAQAIGRRTVLELRYSNQMILWWLVHTSMTPALPAFFYRPWSPCGCARLCRHHVQPKSLRCPINMKQIWGRRRKFWSLEGVEVILSMIPVQVKMLAKMICMWGHASHDGDTCNLEPLSRSAEYALDCRQRLYSTWPYAAQCLSITSHLVAMQTWKMEALSGSADHSPRSTKRAAGTWYTEPAM